MRKELIDVTWEQGYNVGEPSTTLGSGEAEKIQNWYPARSGLRARRGWVSGTTTVVSGTFPTTRQGRGIWVGPSTIHAVHANDSASYEVWTHALGDLDTGSWTPHASNPFTSSDTTYPVVFATNVSGGVSIESGGSTAFTGGARKFRTNAFHNALYFQGGCVSEGGSYLKEQVFDGTNYIAVGYEDGYPVLDMTTYRGALAIGKGNGVWLLSGSGVNSYSLKPIDGDARASLGRSMCSTPTGLYIVGSDAVWNYQNQVTRISGPLEGTFAVPSDGFVHTAYQNGLLHIAVSDGTYYVFNTATGAWSTEAAGTLAEGPNSVHSRGDKYLYATAKGATTNSLGLYRKLSTLVPARDAAMGEVFWAKTPLMFLGDGKSRIETRTVYIQLRQHGTASSQPPLEISVYNDKGTVLQHQTEEMATEVPSVRRIRVDFGAEVEAFQLELKQTLGSTHTTICEPEKIQAVVNITERR